MARCVASNDAERPTASAVLQRGVRGFQRRQLGQRVLVVRLGGSPHAIEPLLDDRQVGQRQLELDHLAVAHRIDRSP